MLFNSYAFILVFLPLTWVGFFVLSRLRLHREAKFWLTLASYLFYAYWSAAYMLLLCGSVVVNYVLGSRITRLPRRGKTARALLVGGVAANLALLVYYKYTGFLVATASELSGIDYVIPNIVLPLGISFYTFTQIAYLVDAYREDLGHYDFLTYNLFITFFPQLIAGPLLLHSELMPQLARQQQSRFDPSQFSLGVLYFVMGLGKKVLLADRVSTLAGDVFSRTSHVGFADAWLGALAYTIQLYFDFSGYSDMAIGLSLMFGLILPINFNSPYQASSIIDFWRRWHMTLSRFLRDYLYIGLGGSRRGTGRRYANLLITMVLGGLWHGAGWTFLIWGALHGLYLVINHGWRALGWRMPVPLAWLLTMVAVVIGWVFFRAPTVGAAVELLTAMAGINGLSLSLEIATRGDVARVGVLLAGCVLLPNSQRILAGVQQWSAWAVAAGATLALSLLSLRSHSEFLYFQF